jgi:hypothetical protein
MWWAHPGFTRINIKLTILTNGIEEFLYERDFRETVAGHEVDDVQPIEQSLRERACGHSLRRDAVVPEISRT